MREYHSQFIKALALAATYESIPAPGLLRQASELIQRMVAELSDLDEAIEHMTAQIKYLDEEKAK